MIASEILAQIAEPAAFAVEVKLQHKWFFLSLDKQYIATGSPDRDVLKGIPTGHIITYVPTPNTLRS